MTLPLGYKIMHKCMRTWVQVRYTCLREGRDINQTSEDLLTLYCHGLRLAEPFTKLLSAITKEVL